MPSLNPSPPFQRFLRRLRPHRAGVMMVEALVGILVMSLAVPSIYMGLQHATRIIFYSSESFAAQAMCKEKIEEMLNMTADEIKTALNAVRSNEYVLTERDINIARRGLLYAYEINGTRQTRAYYTPRGNTNDPFSGDYFDVLTIMTWSSPANLNRTATLRLFTRIYTK